MKLLFAIFLQTVFLTTVTLCGPAPELTEPKNEKNEEFHFFRGNVSKKADEGGVRKNSENTLVETKSLSQKLLDSQSDLREYFANKVGEIYATLKEIEKSTDLTKTLKLNVDQVPRFADPFYIGKFNKTYKLADIQYFNIKVYGMSNFTSYDMSIDEMNRKANITLVADRLKIQGNYTLSNFLRYASGAFAVELLDNVTYNERDLYCKFKDDVDVASAEATMTYGRSESNYQDIGVLAHLFEGVISNKLTEEILYRVGREIGHKIRHVTTSKILQTSQTSQSAENNRIAAIIKSLISEIRTLLSKSSTKQVPLRGISLEMKARNNFMNVSNVTLSGLDTLRAKNDIKVNIGKDDVSIGLELEAGPLTIAGQLVLVENQNSTPVPIAVQVEYLIQSARAKFVVSAALGNDESSFEVSELEVNVSQPALKMKSDKIRVKEEDLQKLAQLLQPDVESELYKWLKDFANEIFQRARLAPSDAEIQQNYA